MAEQPYETEDVLQKLLEDYPELLSGDATPGAARGWLLIGREVSLASEGEGSGRWSVDHLFLDQDAVPTIVEVKRSSDTRIRREVVGQMLDYAANAVVYWRLDRLRATFEAACESCGEEPTAVLAGALGIDNDPDEYWERVRTNLAAGRLRLVFVADEIPAELRRVVEYLNGQMESTEVLAIEVKQYVDSDGLHQTLVPRVVGQTEAARETKGGLSGREWDRASILQELAGHQGKQAVSVAERIFEWADARGDLRYWFGKGQKDGSFQAGLDNAVAYLFPFALYSYGRIEIQFQWMLRRAPFDAMELRVELQKRLNAIPGVTITDESLAKRPSIPLAAFHDDTSLKAFTDSMDWAFAQSKVANNATH
jgi:hypothetical protein